MTLKITYASNKQFADETATEFQSQLENLGFKKKQVGDMVAGFRDGMTAQLGRMKALGAVEYVEAVEPELKSHPVREFNLPLTRAELEALLALASGLVGLDLDVSSTTSHTFERARALLGK